MAVASSKCPEVGRAWTRVTGSIVLSALLHETTTFGEGRRGGRRRQTHEARGVDCPDPLAVAIGDPALHTPPKRIRRSRRRDRSSPVAVTRWPVPTLSPSASMRSSRYRTSEASRPQRQHRLLSPRQGRPSQPPAEHLDGGRWWKLAPADTPSASDVEVATRGREARMLLQPGEDGTGGKRAT
jgi:hypothetical protein